MIEVLKRRPAIGGYIAGSMFVFMAILLLTIGYIPHHRTGKNFRRTKCILNSYDVYNTTCRHFGSSYTCFYGVMLIDYDDIDGGSHNFTKKTNKRSRVCAVVDDVLEYTDKRCWYNIHNYDDVTYNKPFGNGYLVFGIIFILIGLSIMVLGIILSYRESSRVFDNEEGARLVFITKS